MIIRSLSGIIVANGFEFIMANNDQLLAMENGE